MICVGMLAGREDIRGGLMSMRRGAPENQELCVEELLEKQQDFLVKIINMGGRN